MNVGETERIFLRHSSGSPIDCKWKLRCCERRAELRFLLLAVAHPLGTRSAAVRKRAEVAEDGVGCDFRRVGSLAVSPRRALRRQRHCAARSAALPKHSQVVGNAFFSCNG
jgi:hypothetical protein